MISCRLYTRIQRISLQHFRLVFRGTSPPALFCPALGLDPLDRTVTPQTGQSESHWVMASFNSSLDDNSGGGLALGEISMHCKAVVVAIDFGTTYSGIAFTYKDDPGNIQFGAPTANDGFQRKVPTALLSNDDGTWEFGNVAEAKYNEILMSTEGPASAHLFKRFKMVLLREESGFDTLMALSISGKEVPLMELVIKSLERLKDFSMEKVILGYGADLDPAKDVQWVLTVPAIWNGFGKAFMRKAAVAAGLIDDEHSDNLILVLEPEGAALAVHTATVQHSLLGVGSRFLVLDCGGGTVDITAHEVTSVKPLVLKSIGVPTGGEWGGEYVNLEFKKFLKELLGPELYNLSELPYEFYSIGEEFNRVKVNFDPSSDPALIRLIDVLDDKKQLINLAEVYNIVHPEKPVLITPALRKGFLSMSNALMRSFFEPFLQAVVTETRNVLRMHSDIGSIVVVGGFGSSQVLIGRIKSEFQDKAGVRVLLPARPQEAIVHGAVLCGLYHDLLDEHRTFPASSGIDPIEAIVPIVSIKPTGEGARNVNDTPSDAEDTMQKSTLIQVAKYVTQALALMVELASAAESCRNIEASLNLYRIIEAQMCNYTSTRTVQEVVVCLDRCSYCKQYDPDYSRKVSCPSCYQVRGTMTQDKQVTDIDYNKKSLNAQARADIAAAQSQLAIAKGEKAGLQADLDRIADTVYQKCADIGKLPKDSTMPNGSDPSFSKKRDAFLRKLLAAAMILPQTETDQGYVPDLDKLKATDLALVGSTDEVVAVVKSILLK